MASQKILLCRYRDTIINETRIPNSPSSSLTNDVLSQFENHDHVRNPTNQPSNPTILTSSDVSDLPDSIGGEYEEFSDQTHENIIIMDDNVPRLQEEQVTQSPKIISQQEFHTTRVNRQCPPITLVTIILICLLITLLQFMMLSIQMNVSIVSKQWMQNTIH